MARSTIPEDDEAMRVLYRDTAMSLAQIGERFGVSSMVVTRVLADEPRRPHRRRPYDLDSEAFNDLSQEAPAYWLGFLYADGSVARTNITVALSRKDGGHIGRFLGFLKCDKRPGERLHTSGDGKRHPVTYIGLSDDVLAERLTDLGITAGRPLDTLHMVPDGSRSHFLRGWFDGDGSVLITPRIDFAGPPTIVKSASEIFIREAGANRVKVRTTSTGKMSSVTYKGVHRCAGIVEYLYRDATIWLPRKRDRIDAWPKAVRAQAIRHCPTCGHSI